MERNFIMITAMFNCQIQCLPGAPFRCSAFLSLLAIAGAVFSLVMLIDCLKRKPDRFLNPLTKNGEYDKLIWAIGIVASLAFYFIGAIAYFFVVKRSKPDNADKSQPPQQ